MTIASVCRTLSTPDCGVKLERSMLLRRARESVVRGCGLSLSGKAAERRSTGRAAFGIFWRDAKSDTTFMNHRRLSERMAAPVEILSRNSRQLNFDLCLKHFSKSHRDSKVSLEVLDPREDLTPKASVILACLAVCMFGSSCNRVARLRVRACVCQLACGGNQEGPFGWPGWPIHAQP